MTIPAFWDPIFLEKKRQFIVAMGAYFADNPAVVVSSSCVNALTGDWNPGARTDEEVATFLALGYTPAVMLAACTSTIDATMQAFPTQAVSIGVGSMPRAIEGDSEEVALGVLDYGNTVYPGRLIAQKGSLSATTANPEVTDRLLEWQFMFDNRPLVAAQMVGFVTGDAADMLMAVPLP